MKNLHLMIAVVTTAFMLAACANQPAEPSNADKIATTVAATLAAFPSTTPLYISTSTPPTLLPTPGSEINWASYRDPKFGFTVEYPATWTVEPRKDEVGNSGGTVKFNDTAGMQKSYTIEIGQHVQAISATDSLAEWSDKQSAENSMYAPDELKTVSRQNIVVDGLEAFFVRGASPLTEYQMTNIRQGKSVWFIWTNFGETAGTVYLEIYQHMLDSIHFSQS